MALYLGNSENVKIYINNIPYSLKFFTETFKPNGVLLLSSEGYVLRDINGLHLTAEEDD